MNQLKSIADLLPIPSFSTIILCFFFPFLIIKCGNTELLSFSGKDLITGISNEKMSEIMEGNTKNPMMNAFGNDKNSTDISGETSLNKEKKSSEKGMSPNILMIFALLAAIFGLLVFFLKSIKNKKLFYIISAGIGFVCFLIFNMQAQANLNKMGLGDTNADYGMLGKASITAEMGSAFYIAMIVNLIIILFYGYYTYYLKNLPNVVSTNISLDTE